MPYGGNPIGSGAYGGGSQLAPPPVGPPPAQVELFAGVTPSQVGAEYDLAIGFDPGSGTTTMFGYVVDKTGSWSEAPNIQDEQRIVQIASPNNSDRYTSYPKVTQDDWSGGEGQEFFVDPTKYYQSYKMDVTKPGHLGLVLDAFTVTATPTGSSRAPVVSDGLGLAAGLLTASPNALVDYQGNLYYLAAAGTPEPLYGVLDPQGGAFFATAAGVRQGIYRLANVPAGAVQPGNALWNTDLVEPTATQGLAYLSTPPPTGGLYYIRNDNKLLYVGTVAAGTVVYTGLTMEAPLRFLCNTATGLLFATQAATITHQNQVSAILYSFDGVNATRIYDFAGIVRAGYEMNGITYLLFEYQQNTSTSPQFTLMSYSNGQLTTLFDQRYAAPDFQSTMSGFATSPYGASLSGDGRFLFIGWPGYYPLVFDTVRSAFIRSGPAPVVTNLVWAHRLYPLLTGVTDVVSVGAGGPASITFTRSAAGSTMGSLTSSWIDFGIGGVVKAFRCIEVELEAPVPAFGAVNVGYRLDNQTTFTPITAKLLQRNGDTVYLLPTGTKGERIQYQIKLTMGGTTSPIIRSAAVTGNPARVWKPLLSCRRGQQKRNGQPDMQGTATDLLANIIGAYNQGGYVSVYVPDPTNPLGSAPVGVTPQPYVSVTTAKIENYTWTTNVSPGNVLENDGVGYASEGILDVQLAEQL